MSWEPLIGSTQNHNQDKYSAPILKTYGAYISRVCIFANFVNLEAFAKLFETPQTEGHNYASAPKPRL